MTSSDAFDLHRFVQAQDDGGTYARAVDELRAGRKTSHWMWFVFPQVAGLGRTPTAQRYALTSLAEARAYLAHPVLGPRLRECCTVLTELPGNDPEAVLDEVDAMKLRSSLTLFLTASGDLLFQSVLDKYFGGVPDDRTVSLLPTSTS